ncbi:MAG: SDR family oxidoreductase [Gracilibacteraceae bacterium]|jgi:3-oxoacyl-[acyl-carrier protein] reductase|nr:SDR family oxidoreductase [Gracilibacteraceae bacterium]
MLLAGKIALITGTNRGIGRAAAELFVENGALVYANARGEGSLADQASDRLIPLYFDVTDAQAAKAAVMRIKKEQGRLDCLVNNAGVMKDALIGMIDAHTVRDIFAVNVFAVMELLQLAARVMKKQNSGSIINLASIVGVNGNAGQLAYSASKGAVVAMTRTAAKELAPFNIRVNAVAPGMIDTDMFRSIGESRVAEQIARIGMRRLGTPAETARTCLYLASDLSAYVTGQIIGVDGGAIV